jgi:hypothetical protein
MPWKDGGGGRAVRQVSLTVAQDEALLRLLRRARFSTVFVDVETPRAASLLETRKTQSMREDIVTAVHRIQASTFAWAGRRTAHQNRQVSR